MTPAREEAHIDVPADYAGDTGHWIAAVPADSAPKGSWWQTFNDPALDALQASVAAESLSLRVALARFEQAQALAQSASSGLWPKIGAGVSHTRARTSTQAPNYSSTRANPVEDFQANGALSYEIDLFGRIRSGAASARALASAAKADSLAVELAVRAELTNDYFQICALDAQIEVLEETIHTNEQAVRIVEHLQEAGAATAGDVSLSRAQLESAKTQRSDARIRRSQTEHALATLLGKAPTDWHMPSKALARTFSAPAIRPGLPATLLQRRPDIAAAQRRVESAQEQVGLARSAYFPVFTLNAVIGRESAQASNWFESPARFWSIAPTALVTLFDGGQRRAQVRAAAAGLEETTAVYRRTVLTAFAEVEDQLIAVRELQEARRSASAAVDSAMIAQSQAQHRLEAGATTYLELANAQNALLTARLAEISISQRQIAATTLLVRALGGTWE